MKKMICPLDFYLELECEFRPTTNPAYTNGLITSLKSAFFPSPSKLKLSANGNGLNLIIPEPLILEAQRRHRRPLLSGHRNQRSGLFDHLDKFFQFSPFLKFYAMGRLKLTNPLCSSPQLDGFVP